MITIPATILLVVFVALFLVLAIMMGAHVYHGFRFGRHDRTTMAVNSAFLIAVATIVTLTALLLIPVDWSQTFVIDFPSISVNTSAPTFDLQNISSEFPDEILPNQ